MKTEKPYETIFRKTLQVQGGRSVVLAGMIAVDIGFIGNCRSTAWNQEGV